MSSKTCSVENCMSKARGRGMCVAHLNRERYHGRIPEANKALCSMVGCPSYARFKALCGKHYTQAQRADVRRKMNECAVKPCPVDVYRGGLPCRVGSLLVKQPGSCPAVEASVSLFPFWLQRIAAEGLALHRCACGSGSGKR